MAAGLSGRLIGLALAALPLGACTDADPGPRFFPLAEGHRWQYRIELRRGEHHDEQRLLVRNLGPARLEGGRQALAQWVNGSIHYYLLHEDGLHQQAGTRRAGLYLPLPAAPGTTWKARERTRLLTIRKKALEAPDSAFRLPLVVHYRIVSTDARAATPAGEFSGCLEVEGNGEREIEGPHPDHPIRVRLHGLRWFCPGVGLVRAEREEGSDSGFLNDGSETVTLIGHQPP
ncbi:MAG: hypothetical protein D6786_07480 [Gammaproteobacteria bacterium]|nr:MAG: hypothetical protein D6786_07480 [Gammaproteobacteria bacterium]